jgi:hypothetical protein
MTEVGTLFSSAMVDDPSSQSSIEADANLIINLLCQPATIQYLQTKYSKKMDTIEYMHYVMELDPEKRRPLNRSENDQTRLLCNQESNRTHWNLVANTVSKQFGLTLGCNTGEDGRTKLDIYIYFENLNDVRPPISTYVDMIRPNHYLFRVKEVVFAIEKILQSMPEIVSTIQAQINIGNEFRLLVCSGNRSENGVSRKIHQLFCDYFTVAISDVTVPLGKLLGVRCWVHQQEDIILVFADRLS